jgi:DNA-binding response OmpR family regulator
VARPRTALRGSARPFLKVPAPFLLARPLEWIGVNTFRKDLRMFTSLSLQPSTVLLAEEDPELRESMAEHLRHEGYRVIEVEDGLELEDYLEALESGALLRPDVIVSAVAMQGHTGLEVLARLRGKPSSPPVIQLSSAGDWSSFHEAERLGADYVFEKPLDVDDLSAAIFSVAA